VSSRDTSNRHLLTNCWTWRALLIAQTVGLYFMSLVRGIFSMVVAFSVICQISQYSHVSFTTVMQLSLFSH